MYRDHSKEKEGITVAPIFSTIFQSISKTNRKKIPKILVLTILGALAEVVTIGAVIPFVTVLFNASAAESIPLLGKTLEAFGISSAPATLLTISALFITAAVGSVTLRILLLRQSNLLVFAAGADVAIKMLTKTLSQNYDFYMNWTASSALSALNKVNIVISAVFRPVLEALASMIISIAILLTLLIISPLAALAASLLVGGIYLAVVAALRNRLTSNAAHLSHYENKRVKITSEAMNGIREVLIDASEKQFLEEFGEAETDFRKRQAKNAFYGQLPKLAVEAAGIVTLVSIACVLALQGADPGGTIAILAVLALSAQRLLPHLQKIYAAWAQVIGNVDALRDVCFLLELPASVRPSRTESDSNLRYEPTTSIELKDVSYCFPDSDKEILAGVNFRIERGTCIGIVGKSGSGKSTLLSIAMGLIFPTNGVMKLNGKPVNPAMIAALQSKLGIVPQDVHIWDMNILRNVAPFETPESLDVAKAKNILRQVGLGDWIDADSGLDLRELGEAGRKLSGGQKQRLALARALYKNCNLLILDEATSALDPASEQGLLDCVQDLKSNVLALLVTHRYSALRICDEVYELTSAGLTKLDLKNIDTSQSEHDVF